jgi:hypothetical protein
MFHLFSGNLWFIKLFKFYLIFLLFFHTLSFLFLFFLFCLILQFFTSISLLFLFILCHFWFVYKLNYSFNILSLGYHSFFKWILLMFSLGMVQIQNWKNIKISAFTTDYCDLVYLKRTSNSSLIFLIKFTVRYPISLNNLNKNF